MKFQSLGLITPIVKSLEDQGYTSPTPIQEKAIPPALEGRDVLGCARTGTGKTCAFATPILQRLNAAPVKGHPIRALVLTPTRELALQIQESFEAYGRNLPLRSAVIFGGVGQAPQVSLLRQGVDILVATPGRLLDLHGQGLLSLSSLEIFVLDEADRMLDMGFIHDVRRIWKLLPAQKQTLFFSATMPPEVASLVRDMLRSPVRVEADPVSSPAQRVAQKVYLVDRGNKTKLLARLIRDEGIKNALVFTRTKHGANKVSGELQKMGLSAAAIHGNKSQSARQLALSQFKEGTLQVLVATDIAARGLDIEELSHVFNYNLPEVPETYIHRIGRTGRAGRGGVAISFSDSTELPLLKGVEALLGQSIPVIEEHEWPMTVLDAPQKDAQGRAVNPEDAEARAAAKERRRIRATEAAKKPSQPRQAAPKQPAAQSPAPWSAAAPQSAEAPQPAAKKRNRKKAKKPLSEAQSTGVLMAPPQEGARPRAEFARPDPLAGPQIMDATARLLASRPRSASQQTANKQQARPASPPQKKRPSRPDRPEASAKPAQARNRRSQQRPPMPPQPPSGQKDSTEQPSLMKPYYLKWD